MRIHFGTEGPNPVAGDILHAELLARDAVTAADSPMIAACYEAYLCMEKMLEALAELRGDDAEN
jgi:hypothetical protein